MEDLGFTQEESSDVFKIVAATLKLGNLNFVPTTNMDGTEGCSISNEYGKLSRFSIVSIRAIIQLWKLHKLFSPRVNFLRSTQKIMSISARVLDDDDVG